MPPFCEKHRLHMVKCDDGLGWHCPQCESGAPLQPGATQPEHDGVAHDNENFSQCKSYFHECRCLLSRYHAGRHRDRAGISAICWNDIEATERTFTHSELTTLLERMARLAVQEAEKAVIGQLSIGWEQDESGEWKLPDTCIGPIAAIRAIADDTKLLQQLREAVERP